ncbi:MAG: hypothetical protein CFE38_00605 [Comamonadaceae bacterium PBBC1]|nr:MAG: hypothetical protein CFE38_00605 [Comamonadaceae bacterium PBBC1]
MIFQVFRRGAQIMGTSCVVMGLSACGGGGLGQATVGVPGAPTVDVATPDRASASVRLNVTPPASDGGAAVTSPVVLWFGESASSPVTVTGLTRGASYVCSVSASNSAGTSPSSASVSVSLAGL